MGPSRLDQLLEMLSRSPGDRDLRYFVATEYFQQGAYDRALSELEEYLKSGDDEGMGHKMRGVCLARLGRAEEARAALQAGIEAALRHRHRDLASDIEETLEGLFPPRGSGPGAAS